MKGLTLLQYWEVLEYSGIKVNFGQVRGMYETYRYLKLRNAIRKA